MSNECLSNNTHETTTCRNLLRKTLNRVTKYVDCGFIICYRFICKTLQINS